MTEQYPLLTALLAEGAVIEHENHYIDDFDTDAFYTVNGVELLSHKPEAMPLLHELWDATATDVLVWESIHDEAYHHCERLVGFTADGGA